MFNFKDILDHSNVDQLKIRLKLMQLREPVPTRKAEIAKRLFAELLDLNTLKATWSRLSELEKLALQEAIYNHDGYVNTMAFESKYQQPHPDRSNWSEYRSRNKNTSIELYVFFYPITRYGYAVYVPDDVQCFLKKHISSPPEFSLETVSDLADNAFNVLETEQYIGAEINTLINTIKDNKLKVSAKTGLPSKALLQKLSAQLNEPYKVLESTVDNDVTTMKAFGWVQILRAATWIKIAEGKLQIKARKGVFEQRNCDMIKTLFWDWQAQADLDELNRISEVKGQKGKGKRYLTDLVMRRGSCTETLKQCPIDEWVKFTDFLRLMRANNHFFRVSLDTSYLYIGDSHYGRLYNDDSILTIAYTRCLLMEYFATLGLIDIAYVEPTDAKDKYFDDDVYDLEYLSSYDGLEYIRLTQLGAFVLGMSDSYTEPFVTKQTPISLLSKHRVKFLQTATMSESVFIANFADELNQDTWQLSNTKLLAHIENGGELTQLHEFILAREEQPYLPTETELLFKTLTQNKQAVTREGLYILLTCQSEKVAKNIAEAPKLKKWCQRVGKVQLIIPDGKEPTFRKLINELNYAMPIKSNRF